MIPPTASTSPMASCTEQVCKLANVLKARGVTEGRPRLHLHADDPSRWTPKTRCSSSTPPAPPASPRACCTPPAATCLGGDDHKYVFDYRDGDVYWCTADVGWVTGHSYIVYGPLANGATT
jgi:hypothetical protein